MYESLANDPIYYPGPRPVTMADIGRGYRREMRLRRDDGNTHLETALCSLSGCVPIEPQPPAVGFIDREGQVQHFGQSTPTVPEPATSLSFQHEYDEDIRGDHRLVVHVQTEELTTEVVGTWQGYRQAAYCQLADGTMYFTYTDYAIGSPFTPEVVYKLVEQGKAKH